MDLFGPVAANDNDRRVCPVCDGTVVGKPGKVFCSRPCKRHDSDQRNRPAQEERRLLAAPERQCAWCDGPFKNLDKEILCCSRECGRNKAALSRKPAKPATYRVYRPLCGCCGVRFTAYAITSRLCSLTCKAKDARRQAMQHSIANDNRDRTPRNCKECGSSFVPEYGNKRRAYCTSECMKRRVKRVAKRKREAMKRGVLCESVDPIAVFDRDDWKCMICGIDTPRDKRGSYEPDAPEMDHIYPLSKGGSHTYDNVQCACRQCNAKKSDSIPIAA